MPSPPKVRLFVLCDAAVEDPLTGKISLVGVFDRFTTAAFPASCPPCVAYARMTGLRGLYELRVEIVSPDLQTVVAEGNFGAPLAVDDPIAPVELWMALSAIGFPGPGRYTVRLLYNHRIAEEFSLIAEAKT